MSGIIVGIGFKAIAGMALGKAASGAKAAGKWLGGLDLVHVLLLVACIALAVDHVALIISHRHAAKIESQLSKCTSVREVDRVAYTKAQTDAAALNKAQVTAKETQSRKVSDDERQAYLGDLAKLRADDQRMRQQVNASAKSASGPTASPAPSAAASGADGDELHLPAREHLQASEIELRLMHLQNWVEKQLSIDPNKP